MLDGSTSGATKDSCMSTALNRWSATEMRWNKNAVSWASPVAALNRRPGPQWENPKSKELLPPEFRARFVQKKARGDNNTIIINIIIIMINDILTC